MTIGGTRRRRSVEEILDEFCPKNPDKETKYTLIFVPHEDLGVVPFAALHEKKGSPCLIEQYAISVSPAIRIFRQLEASYACKVLSGEAEGSPLLVGRRSGYPSGWTDLKQAHDEVRAAAQALGPTALTIIDDDTNHPGTSATMKERVMKRLPEASWIHFSVHGQFSSEFPQGSLLLGNDDQQRLTAAEIIASGASSNWGARCAIASACQSGLGSVAGGGIMGLARAFMLAGVPSCVLSMWEVDETFCTSFHSKLYVALVSGKDIGDAIQSTTISMMREVEPPEEDDFFSTESSEPVFKWSPLDWPAFSCFGFPGAVLPALSYHCHFQNLNQLNDQLNQLRKCLPESYRHFQNLNQLNDQLLKCLSEAFMLGETPKPT